MDKYAISNKAGIKANVFTNIDTLYNTYITMCESPSKLENLETIIYYLENQKYYIFIHKKQDYYILKLAEMNKPKTPNYSFYKKDSDEHTFYSDNINEVYKKCVETVSDAKIGSLERIFNNLKNNGIHEIIYNDEKYYIARLKNVTLPIIGY